MKMTSDLANELLSYDANSGKLIWKERHVSFFVGSGHFTADHICKIWNSKFAGTVAGMGCDDDYSRIRIFGKRYRAHRLIHLMVNGSWPRKSSEHRKRTSKTGVTGIYYQAKARKYEVRVNGVYIGIYQTIDEAKKIKEDMKLRANAYHPNEMNKCA